VGVVGFARYRGACHPHVRLACHLVVAPVIDVWLGTPAQRGLNVRSVIVLLHDSV